MKRQWVIPVATLGIAAAASGIGGLIAAAIGSSMAQRGDHSFGTIVAGGLGSAGFAILAILPVVILLQRGMKRFQANLTEEGIPARPPRMCWPFAALASAHKRRTETTLQELEQTRSRIRQLEIARHLAEIEVQHLQGVLHALRDAVIVTNSFNELVLANDAAASLLQFDREHAISKPIAQLVNEQEIVGLINEAVMAGGGAGRRNSEMVMNHQTEARNIEISVSSVADPASNKAGVVTILHDITQEREVSRMKNEFVSKASHELRTPLSSIRAYIEMLIDGEAQDEKSRREFYHIIQHESERLGRLIDNMLNISRIEAGIISANWETVDMVAICSEAVELLLPQAQSKAIRLTMKKPHQPCQVEADRDMMQQVVTNLISNAVKYTPKNGTVSVTPDLTDCDRSVIVSVLDTGLGIPAEALPKLFGKFYRVNKHERVAKGTGLGLNLVKQIVETVHHGEVGVESQVDKGSRFWFIVPCQQGR